MCVCVCCADVGNDETLSPSGLAASRPHHVVAKLLPHHLPERREELDDHRLRDPAIRVWMEEDGTRNIT